MIEKSLPPWGAGVFGEEEQEIKAGFLGALASEVDLDEATIWTQGKEHCQPRPKGREAKDMHGEQRSVRCGWTAHLREGSG